MTGEEFKVMMLNKYGVVIKVIFYNCKYIFNAFLTFFLLVFFCAEKLHAETILGSFTSQVTVNYTPRTCDIKLPGDYDLGTLTPGTKQHKSFSVTINCNYTMQSDLKASIVNGNIGNDSSIVTMSDGSSLRLLESGVVPVKFDGSTFCSDTNVANYDRQCYFTPETTVNPSDFKGETRAAIIFEVVYST